VTGKIIAVANMKGGVGKTATVVMLAEALAASEGKSVLVVDLDPQASASICLAGDDLLTSLVQEGRTIDAYLDDVAIGGRRLAFASCIHGQVSSVMHRNELLRISLLASSPALRLFERDLIFDFAQRGYGVNASVGRIFRLMKIQLERAAGDYDFILIDCAPGISALTEVSIRLADLVIVPTIPDFVSTYGLRAFCNSLWIGELARRTTLRVPTKPHVLITRRKKNAEHNKIAMNMRSENGVTNPVFSVLDVEIPEDIEVAKALGKGEATPTFQKKWGGKIISVLDGLVKETKEALNGARH
jgi:chromosome partitioning protein